MKFSTRSRYGLRFLTYLAAHDGQGFIQLKEVAREECISTKYLEQIVRLLKPSGLLQVSRGAHGGYALAREAKSISLMEIIVALEGSLSAIDCLDNNTCNRKQQCSTVSVWQELTDTINSFFSKKTLADVAKDYNKKRDKIMYHI